MDDLCDSFTSPSFNFRYSNSVQVHKDLYLFEEGSPLTVNGFEICTKDEEFHWHTNSAAFGVAIDYFAVANYKNSVIYVTGGFVYGTYDVLNDVMTYNLQKKIWQTGPSLNEARVMHGSCTLGRKIYVFCGEKSKSIEFLAP